MNETGGRDLRISWTRELARKGLRTWPPKSRSREETRSRVSAPRTSEVDGEVVKPHK
jgi:hypothetical protein